MNYGLKDVEIKLKSFEHGTNESDNPTDVGRRYLGRYPRYQCIDSSNAILSLNKRRPAMKSINSAIESTIEGMHFYIEYDGDESLLVVSGGKIYSCNTSTGVLTELYDLTGSGNAKFLTAIDKCFVCNSTSVAKVEGSDAYRVNITPPSGATAAAKAGGSLALGVYKIYIGYARKVGGVNSLYSIGEAVANVTLSGGNQTVTFSVPNSSDPQVNNKVIWMTDYDGDVWYFYYETNDNTTVTFDITSTGGKNSALLYSVIAQNNLSPEAFEDMTFLDNRIFGKVSNIIYYSKQAGNVYDLECFPASNTIELPYYIVSLFTLDGNLYANCIGNIIKIQNGDPNSRLIEIYGKAHKGIRHYFKYPNTVVSFSGYVIGLTQDGFRIFNKDTVLQTDVSRDIRKTVNKIYSGSSVGKNPHSFIVRDNNRTEYHTGYLNTTNGTDLNNSCVILNLDTLNIGSNDSITAAWEKWSNGFDFAAIDNHGLNSYYGQSYSGKSVIYKKRTDEMIDLNIYINDIFTVESIPELKIKTPYFVASLHGNVDWRQIRVLGNYSATFIIEAKAARSEFNSSEIQFSKSGTGFILDVSRLDVDYLQDVFPIHSKFGIPRKVKGTLLWLEVTQTTADRDFQLIELDIDGILKKGRRS